VRIPQLPAFRSSDTLAALTVRGTGLYPIANCTNHACAPNVVSVTRQTGPPPRRLCFSPTLNKGGPRHPDWTLELVVVRPVQAGEELFISYIDETRPWRQRQQQLQEGYRFTCRCTQCIVDAARDGVRLVPP
jgi:hypothetical protein